MTSKGCLLFSAVLLLTHIEELVFPDLRITGLISEVGGNSMRPGGKQERRTEVTFSIHHSSIHTSIHSPIYADLTQHLRKLSDKLSLGCFWEQGVKRGGELALHVSFIFNLEMKQKTTNFHS